MEVEHVRAVVRDRLKGLQHAIDENRAEFERLMEQSSKLSDFIKIQEAELVQLKQWLIANGAEDVNNVG